MANVIVLRHPADPNTITLGVAHTVSTVTSLAVQGTTADQLAAGRGGAFKWVVAIEGYRYLLTDAAPAAAIAAHSGRDWTQALGGLLVDLQNSQKINPYEPFTSGGTCQLRIEDYDGNDTFGVDVARRGAGIETTLRIAADRDDLGFGVRNGTGFPLGDAFIGTECVEVSSAAPDVLWLSRRGKYSPLGCSSGAGGIRFPSHHRVAVDDRQVQMNPVIASQPRAWLGRRVTVFLHKWDGTSSASSLNSRADAQIVFSGKIAGIQDDGQLGHTVVDLKHELDLVKDATIFRDPWGATCMDGLYVPAGGTFTLVENVFATGGTITNTANAMTVVASGATGTNQMNAKYYAVEDLCDKLNSWLAGELAAGRLTGHYVWASPVSSNVGLRTKCYWHIHNSGTGGTVAVNWTCTMPSGIASFLGFDDSAPVVTGSTTGVGVTGFAADVDKIYQSDYVPWRSATWQQGNGALGLQIQTNHERGAFQDQYALLPSSIKASINAATGDQWGLFLVDEKALMVGKYNGGLLTNCVLTDFTHMLAGGDTGQNIEIRGRRCDDPNSGPVTLRQVLWLEGPTATIIKYLFYSTGTPGWNHSTNDRLGYGLGIGLPGELLGNVFDASVDQLPQAQLQASIRIDEPKKLSEILAADLHLRRAFLVWKDEHLIFKQWHTPMGSLAIAALTEENKAAPAKNDDNQRTPTLESAEWASPIVKVDFNPDFAFGRDVTYRRSLSFEDQVGVDQAGEGAQTRTIKAPNLYVDSANTGAGVEALLAGYLAGMPMFSRSTRHLTRPIGPELVEELAPGDIITVADNFARDPLTGQRRVLDRPAVVTGTRYSWGGAVPGNPKETQDFVGEIDIYFLDLHRGTEYAPAARVNPLGMGSGSGGYDALSRTISLLPHEYSETSEAVDCSWFQAGYAVLLVEIDPASSSAPLYWARTIEQVTVQYNQISFTEALGTKPGEQPWDSSKQYRLIFDHFTAAAIAQRDFAFQADYRDERIEDLDVPYEWSVTGEDQTTSPNDASAKAELHANLAYGDGKGFDVGYEKALVTTLNQFHDRKSAHQSLSICPTIFGCTNIGGSVSDWTVCKFYPIFLGTEQLSGSITRTLTVRPWLGRITGLAGQLRVSLCRSMPRDLGDPLNLSLVDRGVYVEATWTATQDAQYIAEPQQLSLVIKDATSFGVVYLVIEYLFGGRTYGLAQCIEGPRAIIT